MEIIRGKTASFFDAATLTAARAAYRSIHVDIGTGDGRYVQHLAQTSADAFVIGLDACREHLREVSRRASPNTLFVIASAHDIPRTLDGLAAHITINFPWGSLITGLLHGDAGLLDGLARIAQPRATLDIRLNGGALAEAGWPLDAGARCVRDVLATHGFAMRPCRTMTSADLRAFPTTWAKRLAYGRDPRAVWLRGERR